VPGLVLLRLQVPDPRKAATALRRLGFSCNADGCTVGAVRIVFEGADNHNRGGDASLVGWDFSADRDELLKLDPRAVPTTRLVASPDELRPVTHPNGVDRFDHCVVTVPNLDAITAGLDAFAGIPCRRRAEIRGRHAAFLRAGEAVLELIEDHTVRTPSLWGLCAHTPDLDATRAVIADKKGSVGPAATALQGGRIASSPPEAFFGVAWAFLQSAPRDAG
jgi:hypothetical protein